MDRHGTQAVGLDFGGTRIKLGLVNERGEVVARRSTETPHGGDPERVLDALVGAFADLVDGQGVDPRDLRGVGMGTPGPLDVHAERVLLATNIPGWEGFAIKERMEERLELPVKLENDANAAALGEYWVGAARAAESLVFLGLGTGVGGGIILEGRVWRGAHGSGAELGHVNMIPGGEQCGCGSRGCLEMVSSGRAISRRASEELASGRGEALRRIGRNKGDDWVPTPEEVAQAAREGDKAALDIYAQAGRWLGIAVGGFMNIFDPDMVVLGGGVAASSDLLLPYVREEAERHSFAVIHEKVEIVSAELGNDAGVVGAVAPFYLPRR